MKLLKRIAKGIGLLLCGYIAWVIWYSVTPHVREISEPITYREFRRIFAGPDASHSKLRHLMLPEGASNIFYASSSVGLGGRALCYRCSAPLSNMIQHIEGLDLQYTRPRTENEPPPYQPIKTPIELPMMKPYGLDKLEWFNIENISTGFVTGVGGYNSTIWIDAERELYYYYWTD